MESRLFQAKTINWTIFARQGDNPNYPDGLARLSVINSHMSYSDVNLMIDELQEVARRLRPSSGK